MLDQPAKSCADIGGYGKNSDQGIFEQSVMGRKFETGMPMFQTASQPTTPHVLIGVESLLNVTVSLQASKTR